MPKFFGFSIRQQLLLLAALATGSIWAGALFQFRHLQQQESRLAEVQQALHHSERLAQAARQAARERGLTYGWLRSAAPLDVAELKDVRAALDSSLAPLDEAQIPGSGVAARLSDLNRQRARADRRDVDPEAAFSWYTSLVATLLDAAAQQRAGSMVEIGLRYEHINHLQRSVEHLSQLRGVINGVLQVRQITPEQVRQISRQLTLYQEYRQLHERSAPPAALLREAAALHSSTLREVVEVARRLEARQDPAAVGLSAADWWAQATEAVDALLAAARDESQQLTADAAQRLDELRWPLRTTVAVLVVLGLLTLALVLATVGRIVRSLSSLLAGLDAMAHRRNFKARFDDSSPDEFGEISRSVNKLVDIASHVVDEHERISLTDGLTGLHNRRALDRQLDARLHPGRPPGPQPALLLLDVDHFKRINDDFGHPVGDRVLARLAALVRAQVRDDDLVARYGGEEFAVLLPASNLQMATAIADKIRLAVQAHDFGIGRGVTLSVGVALNLEGQTPLALVDAADRALYAAKMGGRNRVVPAEPAA